MPYKAITLKKDIDIDYLVTIHYFEYMNTFTYAGESHDFWEFLCVDKGEVEVYNGQSWQVLKKDEIIFHKPMEFHSLRANGVVAPNLVVISFRCSSPVMSYFENKVLTVNEFQCNLLSSIIHEARNTFSCTLDDPYTTEMTLREPEYFASQQLIKLYLEHFLIDLYRQGSLHDISGTTKVTTFLKERTDSDTLQRIQSYFENNLCRPLCIEDICKDNLISYSKLKLLFHERYNCSVLEYFNQLRIGYAKQLIRENSMNVSEVAFFLGYSSIHYFSRQFKNITGMSPTEYSASIMIRSEVDNSFIFTLSV